MIKKYLSILLTIFILIITSCDEDQSHKERFNDPFSEVKNIWYFSDFYNIFKYTSVYSDSVDHDVFKDSVLTKMKLADSKEERHEIIEYALDLSGDIHAVVKDSGFWDSYTSPGFQIPKIEHKLLKNSLGYIKIPRFMHSGDAEKRFADSLISVIQSLDMYKLKGWIIDLSDNTGGNYIPMILGLSPILGNQIVFYFTDTKDINIPISIKDNSIFADTSMILTCSEFPELKNKNKKLAVIINDSTASSAEYTAIALRSYDHFVGYFENPVSVFLPV